MINIRFGPEDDEFKIGAGSVAITNISLALEELHKQFGTLPLSTLAEPALKTGKKKPLDFIQNIPNL